MDELIDTVKKLTINDAKYYESNTATTSDAHSDITCNPEKFTHTSNGNETVTHTSNGNFEQQLLSNRTIPVLTLVMNLGIDQGTAPIILAPQTLLMTETKEVVADTEFGGALKNRNMRKVSMTGVNGSTPVGGSLRLDTYPNPA